MPGSAVARKYFITQLRRCSNCKLMFRTPTDDASKNIFFYEKEYTQGFTTDMPSDGELSEMKRLNFSGTEKSYSYYIDVLMQLGLGPSNRVFDYGCSWGYGSYQFSRAGFEVVSFEVAPSRARFAHEKLGVLLISPGDTATNDESYPECRLGYSLVARRVWYLFFDIGI